MTAPRTPGTADYRRRVLVGVGWTALQKWAVRFASLATFAVLGRLVGPADIGLATLATAVIGLLTVIADLGASAYVVRAPRLDRRALSTVFWTNLALACGAGLLVAGVAHPLAAVLGEPRLGPVLQVAALLLPLSALATTPVALLTRELDMRPLAFREMIAALFGAAVGLSAAFAGAGVWALVAQALAQAVAGIVVVWRATTWRPTREFHPPAAREMARYGSGVSGSNLVQALHDRTEQFVLGAVAGVEVLAYWAIGTRLLNLVYDVSMAVLDMVALPVMSRVSADRQRLAKTLDSATAGGLLLLVPVLLVVWFTAGWVIPLVFGPGWTPSVALIQVLCLTYAVGGLSWFSRPALLAAGRSGVEFAVTLLGLGVHVAAVVLAAPHGLIVLAWVVTGEAVLMVAVRAAVQRRCIQVGWSVYLRSVRVLVAGGVAVAVAAGLRETVAGTGGQVLAVAAGAVAYLALVWLLNRSLVGEVVGDVRRLAGRNPDPQEARHDG
ncbi:lipopolysaccharide biosynthesis protein [Modestobacter sp. SSW1-42]|uniref:lipopolysaccharide biosynthesis protein n=1 Tax=Modestobacter sp. SSW1-42 TaxID=596372 RepID=UPI003986D545